MYILAAKARYDVSSRGSPEDDSTSRIGLVSCPGVKTLRSDEHGGRGAPQDQSGTRRDGITAVGILFPASGHFFGAIAKTSQAIPAFGIHDDTLPRDRGPWGGSSSV
jgi:hypothetical protein